MSDRIAQQHVRAADILTPTVADLTKRLGRKPRLIQIGANDGITDDPVRPLVADGSVEAILVEPMPAPFAKLKELYRDRPDVRLEQVAVAVGQGDLTLYSLQDQTGTPRFEARTTFSRQKIERTIAKLARNPDVHDIDQIEIVSTTFPARTVAELVAGAGWPGVDVVVIDAEGLDREIVLRLLKADLDVDVIFFEAINLTRQQFPEMLRTLADAGYGTAQAGKDVLAVRDRSV